MPLFNTTCSTRLENPWTPSTALKVHVFFFSEEHLSLINALSTAWRKNYRKICNAAGSKQWPVVSAECGKWEVSKERSVEKNFKMSVIHPSRDDLRQYNLLWRSINKNCDAASITTFLLLNHCLTNVFPKRNWKQRLCKILGGKQGTLWSRWKEWIDQDSHYAVLGLKGYGACCAAARVSARVLRESSNFCWKTPKKIREDEFYLYSVGHLDKVDQSDCRKITTFQES